MKLSIVATLYQSAPYITEFYQRVSTIAKQLVGEDYELILVNDGSPDSSLDLAVQLTERDDHVVVVDLSRNFGHHKAIMAGLGTASGHRVFLIDSDLEEMPEWLLSFAEQMNNEASDVVYGIQTNRKGGLLEKITGGVFYQIFRLFTGIAQPNNIVTTRLMSRRYVDALLLHQERELNIGGLWIVTGFKQCHQTVQKLSTSPTTYSFSRKLSHLVNAVTSFSHLPLFFIFYSGLFISVSALGNIAYLTMKYFFSVRPTGYTSLIASIWLFSGVIVFFIGILGIYISKIMTEVKQRPNSIVRQVFKRTQEPRS